MEFRTIFRDNAFLPQAVRSAMVAQNVTQFTLQKQGTLLGMPGNYNDHEERRNEFDTWTLQLGLDQQLNDNWRMQARMQRGATRKYTAVLNELRVDREFLGMDAVEVYRDRRDADADTVVDLVAEADRGTGDDHLQRPALPSHRRAQLRQSVRGRPRAVRAGRRLARRPDGSRADPGSRRSRTRSRTACRINVLGQGNVSPAAQDYLTSMKWGDSVVTQEFAEVLFTGDIWDGFGPGAFSIARASRIAIRVSGSAANRRA